MSKTPYGTYALQEALKQLRQIKPELVYSRSSSVQGTVFNNFLIAKNKTRFRPVGILDWAHFTMAGLRDAIQHETLNTYYLEMLEDPRSPSNCWKNKELETIKKDYYANRSGEIYE
jgi:hypothetical protein